MERAQLINEFRAALAVLGKSATNHAANHHAATHEKDPKRASLPGGLVAFGKTAAGATWFAGAANRDGTRDSVRTPPETPGAGASAPRRGEGWILPVGRIEFCWIPPGRFAMGSPPQEAGRSEDEGPVTSLTLSQGFWLGRSPVTRAQWGALGGKKKDPGEPLLPQTEMSWHEAKEACERLTVAQRTIGALPAGYAYLLPTEAQWEYACRGGSTVTPSPTEREGLGWHAGNSGGQLKPVNQKKPNAWGLHDMLGNVWEWCRDDYVPTLPGGACTDRLVSLSGLGRVFRGGSFQDSVELLRPAYRDWGPSSERSINLGFRLALTPIPNVSNARPVTDLPGAVKLTAPVRSSTSPSPHTPNRRRRR